MVDWEKDLGIDEEAVEKSAGVDIAPGGRLSLPGIGEKIVVTFVEEPRKITSEKLPGGSSWFVRVEHDNIEYDLPFSKTVAFGVKREMKRHGFSELKGKTFAIIGKEWSDAPAQYKDKGTVKTYTVVYIPKVKKEEKVEAEEMEI